MKLILTYHQNNKILFWIQGRQRRVKKYSNDRVGRGLIILIKYSVVYLGGVTVESFKFLY